METKAPDCCCGAAARQEIAGAQGFDARLRPESEFFDYVARAYRCFLAGDDPGAEAVDEEQAVRFEARSADTVERNRRLEQARLCLVCCVRAYSARAVLQQGQPPEQAAALEACSAPSVVRSQRLETAHPGLC